MTGIVSNGMLTIGRNFCAPPSSVAARTDRCPGTPGERASAEEACTLALAVRRGRRDPPQRLRHTRSLPLAVDCYALRRVHRRWWFINYIPPTELPSSTVVNN